LSVREVADIVGVAEATAKTRMFYARKKLAELVSASYTDGQRQAGALRKGVGKAGLGGRNMRIDLRWARGDPERIRLLARELVANVCAASDPLLHH
jgi:hypothetical protein